MGLILVTTPRGKFYYDPILQIKKPRPGEIKSMPK